MNVMPRTCVSLRRYTFVYVFMAGVAILGLSACSLSDLVNGNPLPANTLDPSAIKTPDGALAAYRSALVVFANVVGGKTMSDSSVQTSSGSFPIGSYVFVTGLLTDELSSSQARFPSTILPSDAAAFIDNRIVPENNFTGSRLLTNLQLDTYTYLQKTRARAREARGALRSYNPDAPKALWGHLFALEGMSEVLMAELFCSGIPLSTIDFDADYTAKPGSTSEEVYQHALTLFDSALVYATDSSRIVHFANLGRARALLALNEYAQAALAVKDVPDAYRYELSYAPTRPNQFFTASNLWTASVADGEGINGQYYGTSNDPRTLVDVIAGNFPNPSPVVPHKYVASGASPGANPGTVPIVLASGVEARLISAEADLAEGNARWLTTLNALRTTSTTCTVLTTPCTAPAGTGGVTGLPLLVDPGSDTARVSLLFHERAAWLFLTGHRQGDLRRLVRQYRRPQNTVYPSGLWGVQQFSAFGEDVNLPVPVEEQETNLLYHGCFNRDA